MAYILYADDDESVRNTIGYSLKGHTLDLAVDGADALAKFQAAPSSYDLVITDYNMFEKDGVELARAIRQSGSTIPIIMLTGKRKEDICEDHADFDKLNITYARKPSLRLLVLVNSQLHRETGDSEPSL